jgi:hypothetical protein
MTTRSKPPSGNGIENFSLYKHIDRSKIGQMPSFVTDMTQTQEGFARLRHSHECAGASSANERKSFINHKPLGLPADEDVRQADGTLTIMAKFRYYDAAAEKPPAVMPKTAVHTEFLRTGRINRGLGVPR